MFIPQFRSNIIFVAEFRGPGVHHRIDDSADDIDMDLDQRFRPNNGGGGGRIILLGDGTEVRAEGNQEAEMFDQDDEDRDLDSQVDRRRTESPSSVKTEESEDGPEKKEKDTRLPEKAVADETAR